MDDNAEVHNRLLAAHPGNPDWDWADGNTEPPSGGDEELPTALYHPIAWYGGTGTSRENAGTEEPTGYVPSRLLFDLLNLRCGNDFRWADDKGLAVLDPTVGMDGTSTLVLRSDLTDRIGAAGYRLFWTVLLNKERQDHNYGQAESNFRWLSASASYLMTGEKIERVSANAWRRRPYGEGEAEPVDWEVRRTS